MFSGHSLEINNEFSQSFHLLNGFCKNLLDQRDVADKAYELSLLAQDSTEILS